MNKKVFGVFARAARIAIVSVCVLAATVALVVTLGPKLLKGGDEAESVSAPVVTDAPVDPITQFRTEREQLYAMQTAQLNEMINGDNIDEETRTLAQRKLLELLEYEKKEATIEGVLQTKGYEDALVTVSQDSVNVLLRGETITSQDTAVVLDLVLRETGVTGGNVKIIPIN